jgi:predicted RNase H-like nuclease
MRKITKTDCFNRLRLLKQFPHWVIGEMPRVPCAYDYKISDEKKKNLEIIDSLSPITDIEKIESLLRPNLLDLRCSTCNMVYSELVEVLEEVPYDTPECLMCIDCLKKGIEILST